MKNGKDEKMKKESKTMKLAAFVKMHGPASAASLCGVSVVTLWRWKTKLTRPEGNNARRLVELGVTIS